jgi:hypothetical protein
MMKYRWTLVFILPYSSVVRKNVNIATSHTLIRTITEIKDDIRG